MPRDHDPRDAGEPAIHIALADSAELSRGTQMALVGGIGSGKTTELLLTHRILNRHSDAVNIFVDLADYTDLSELNTGAILATVGMRIYSLLKRSGKKLPDDVTAAHKPFGGKSKRSRNCSRRSDARQEIHGAAWNRSSHDDWTTLSQAIAGCLHRPSRQDMTGLPKTD